MFYMGLSNLRFDNYIKARSKCIKKWISGAMAARMKPVEQAIQRTTERTSKVET